MNGLKGGCFLRLGFCRPSSLSYRYEQTPRCSSHPAPPSPRWAAASPRPAPPHTTHTHTRCRHAHAWHRVGNQNRPPPPALPLLPATPPSLPLLSMCACARLLGEHVCGGAGGGWQYIFPFGAGNCSFHPTREYQGSSRSSSSLILPLGA